MPFRAAQTITPELLEHLNYLAAATERTEVEIGQVEFRAKALKSADPSRYYMIMGICCSLRRDPAGVRENFELALKHSHNEDSATVQNYIIALHEADDFATAEEVLERSTELFYGNPSALRAILNSAMNLGRVDIAAELEQRMELLGMENCHDWRNYVKGLQALNIDTHAVGELIRHGHRFMREHGFMRPDGSYSFSAEYGCHLHLTRIYPVARSADETYELELLLQDSLFEKAESLRGDGAVSALDVVTIGLSTEGFASDCAVHG